MHLTAPTETHEPYEHMETNALGMTRVRKRRRLLKTVKNEKTYQVSRRFSVEYKSIYGQLWQ